MNFTELQASPTSSSTTSGTVTTITSQGKSSKSSGSRWTGHRLSLVQQLPKFNRPHILHQQQVDESEDNYQHSRAALQRNSKSCDSLTTANHRGGTRSLPRTNSKLRVEASNSTLQPARMSTGNNSSHGVECYGSANPPLQMTKEEFAALPPTIQRKYFSTLERLRFAQDAESDTAGLAAESFDLTEQNNCSTTTLDRKSFGPKLRLVPQSEHLTHPQRSNSIAGPHHFSSPKRPRHRKSENFSIASQSTRQSVILDATDEAFIKLGKRRPQLHKPDHQSLRPATADQLGLKMHSELNENAWMDSHLKSTEDSLFNSIRWLETDDDLDLRLALDDYHHTLRKDVIAHRKSRSSSFRRHLSISKLPFKVSVDLGRPSSTTGETAASNDAAGAPLHHSYGHGRRRSRALSLISSNKQLIPETPRSPSMDPASHYQDPEARMKLRVYLASPHKFDEAVEFGFPSMDQINEKSDKLPKRVDSLPQNHESLRPMQTLLEDRRCSVYSDGATATEPDSPRTPNMLETPSLVQLARHSHDQEPVTRTEYQQAPASSREMTLRMTLTRPDLRADHDRMYGWQKSRPGVSDEPSSSASPLYARDVSSKDSIERQLAAIDQENSAMNDGAMKRLWNKVRRV